MQNNRIRVRKTGVVAGLLTVIAIVPWTIGTVRSETQATSEAESLVRRLR